MNQEIKQRWIEALRSGDYKQTKGTLKDENGFCCLGVLCNLYVKEVVEEEIIKNSWSNSHHLNGYSGGLPKEVIEWCDFDQNEEVILVNMNDSFNNTFDEIADYIEKNL